MIEFSTLAVKDFLSIREVLLPIGDYGVTLITGKGEGAFLSNGAGKTSLFEALVWCLFGRTIRSLPYDDLVVRRGAKEALVAVILRVDGIPYCVVRTKPAKGSMTLSVLEDGSKDEEFVGGVVERTKGLVDLLRCDFETFCNTCYFPQGRAGFFSTATDQQRKAIFDQVLGTSYFQEVEKLAKAAATEAMVEAGQANTEAMNADTTASNKKDELGRAEASLKDERGRTDRERTEAQEEVKLLEDGIPRLHAELTERAAAKKKADAALAKAKKQDDARRDAEALLRGVEADLRVAKQETTSAQREFNMAERTLADASDALIEFDSMLEEERCVTCGQRFVDRETLDANRVKLDVKRTDAKAEWTKANAAWAKAQQREAKKQEAVESARAKVPAEVDVDGAQSEANRAETAYHRSEIALDAAKDKLAEAQRRLRLAGESSKERVEAIEKSVSERKAELGGLAKKAAAARVVARAAEARQSRATFCVEMFGPRGLRSLILENSLPFVSERANWYAARLTGGDVQVEISATSETRKGDSQEKISVIAENAHGASVYEGNSGGERRRIDLAILLALQDLIAGRSSAAIRLAVYDEVFDQLDTEGIERAVEVIRETASKKPVFVISHSEELKGLFEDRIEMVKEGGVSRMEA